MPCPAKAAPKGWSAPPKSPMLCNASPKPAKSRPIVFEMVAQTVSKVELYPDPVRAVVPFTGGSMSSAGPKSLTVRLTRI